ncbi:hypothetical protein JCM10207_008199 [Rhodosporidiobolus poonsookiae]
MPTLKALWKPLAAVDALQLQRSSQALAVANGKAYLFGGELKPRTPVDAAVTEVDLTDNSNPTLSPPSPATANTPWPSARVGHTLTASGDKLYLWGGRGGKDMGTVESSSSLWAFEPATGMWEEMQTTGEVPEARSFHTMTAVGNNLYLHAGCPASGRLSTLHALALDTLVWSSLPSAPEPGRGGTVLEALPSLSTASAAPLLARFGGFAGYELGGLDVFSVSERKWTAVDDVEVIGGGEGPGKRSVHALVGLDGKISWEGKTVVAVLALGEREGAPKELGHDGAGFFHNDAWALLASPSPSGALPAFSWLRLDPSSQSQGRPEARGWFASAAWEGKVVLQGGLNAKNERLSDGWTLEVVVDE